MNNNNNDWLNQMINGTNNNNNNNRSNLYNSYMAPRYKITQVNGRAGAESFRMAPDSDYLLLDSTAPIIWFVKTDGAGFLTAIPFDYSPHVDAPPVDLNDLVSRLTALEAKFNGKSNSGTNKQHRNNNSKPAEGTNQTND